MTKLVSMKLLMIYCKEFSYTPQVKNLDSAEENVSPAGYKYIQTAFIQTEEKDEDNESATAKKLLTNLKWICRKNNTKRILLHSFAHLSISKSSPEFTRQLFDNVQKRLESTNHEVFQTPYGYFLDLHIEAPGFSLARVFKDL